MPCSIRYFFLVALGPTPHLLGYRSLSMITLLVFATTPCSEEKIWDAVIWAMATATASPFVVMMTTSWLTSMLDEYLKTPGKSSLAPKQIALTEESLMTILGKLVSKSSSGLTTCLK